MNLNNYSFEFTPTETSAGGTVLYIANHLLYKCCNDLNIYKKINWKVLLLKLSAQENQILLWELFTDIHLWTLLTLITITYNIFSNVIDPDMISGNLTATLSDHLSQFTIISNMFGNISGNK